MAQYNSRNTKKIGIVLLLLLLLFIILFLLINRKTQPTEQINGTILHGTILFSSQVGEDLSIEFWFDEPKYRLSWSKLEEDPYLHMISLDGETLFHHSVENNTTNISYINPKMHQWIFTEPIEYIDKEAWTEEDMKVEKFVIKKLWSVEGASQDFYLEDMIKYSLNGQPQKVVLRTKGSVPETAKDLIESTYTFESIEKLDTVSKDIFELP